MYLYNTLNIRDFKEVDMQDFNSNEVSNKYDKKNFLIRQRNLLLDKPILAMFLVPVFTVIYIFIVF